MPIRSPTPKPNSKPVRDPVPNLATPSIVTFPAQLSIQVPEPPRFLQRRPLRSARVHDVRLHLRRLLFYEAHWRRAAPQASDVLSRLADSV